MGQTIAENIRNRRTIHHFVPDRLPPRESILAAIEHANWAPNHYLTEPWRYYLIGAETREKICQLNADLLRAKRGDRAADLKLERWREIPGWLIQTCAISKNPQRAEEDYAACCCAAQNMMLYLWSLGIGCKWTTGGVTRTDELFSIMAINRHKERITGLFWYGYPAEIPAGMRKPVASMLSELP